MSIAIGAVREDTPGCTRVLHLNNAGASLQPLPVVERVIRHLELELEFGGYEAADQVADEQERIYRSIARMLGCHAEEIALVDSATRGWDAVFYALAQYWQPGGIVLTLANEFVNNAIAQLHAVRQRGIQIVVLDREVTGEISLPSLEMAIEKYGKRVKLISLTHVPMNSGLVQPAAAVGKVARKHEIPFLLDACQSVGQMPLNVEELGCDMLSATGRKYLRAPRGTGFLYVRRSMLPQLEPAMLDMRSADWTTRKEYRVRQDARKFETWEASIACRLGLGVAVEYALGIGLDAIQQRIIALAAQLRDLLRTMPGVTVRDLPPEAQNSQMPLLSGIVTFTHANIPAQAIFERMQAQGIHVRITPVMGTRIDMEQRRLPDLVRASVHYYNTEEELDRFVEALRRL